MDTGWRITRCANSISSIIMGDSHVTISEAKATTAHRLSLLIVGTITLVLLLQMKISIKH